MNFLRVATSLDSFLKAHKTKKTKSFFPYDWFDLPQKISNNDLPPVTPFLAFCATISP